MGFEGLNCAFHVLNLVLRQQLKTACGVHSLQPHFEHSARASGCTSVAKSVTLTLALPHRWLHGVHHYLQSSSLASSFEWPQIPKP